MGSLVFFIALPIFVILILLATLLRRVESLQTDLLHMAKMLRDPGRKALFSSPEAFTDELPVQIAPEPEPPEALVEETPTAEPPPWSPPEQKPPVEAIRKTLAPRPGELEARIGGVWLVRIGALTLLLGLGFLSKYSIDQGWVSEPARVLSGLGLGGLLWFLGRRFRMRGYDALAQGFAGCGSAVLYLSIYAARTLYGLIGEPLAFASMAGVTAGTVWVALRHKALSLALLAQIGGFLTPLLVGMGASKPHLMFAYFFALNLGMYILASRKNWRSLEYVAWFGTAIGFGAWFLGYGWNLAPVTGAVWSTVLSLFFVFGLLAAGYIASRAQRQESIILLVLNVGLWWLTTLVALGFDHEETMGLLWLGMGLLLIVVGEFLVRRVPKDLPGCEIPRLLGAALLLLGVPAVLAAVDMVLGWTVVAAALLIFTGRCNSRVLRGAGMAGFMIAVAGVIAGRVGPGLWGSGLDRLVDVQPFLNGGFARELCVVLGLAIAGLAQRWAPVTLRSAAALLALLVLGWEIDFAIVSSHGPGVSAAAGLRLSHCLVAASATLIFAFAAWRSGRLGLARLGTMLSVVATGFFVGAIETVQVPEMLLILNARCLPLLLVPAMLAAVHALMLRTPAVVGEDSRVHTRLSGILALALPLLLLSIEAFRFFGGSAAGSGQGIEAAAAALSVTWTVYAAYMLVLGICLRSTAVRLSALALLGVTLVKVALVDLAFLEQAYRIITFIVLGAILMTGAWLYNRFAARLMPAEKPAASR